MGKIHMKVHRYKLFQVFSFCITPLIPLCDWNPTMWNPGEFNLSPMIPSGLVTSFVVKGIFQQETNARRGGK